MWKQASTNHSKTVEELSGALDTISDAVAICNIESKLIRSKAMQNAIAKLYIAIFSFFGDAATWYKSSSKSKLLNSLHNDFSERFRSSLDVIKQLAMSVKHVANLGSEAEVRVVRLELEDLQDELQDLRIGLSGQLRVLAEMFHWQHGQNLEQHKRTQALLMTQRHVAIASSAQDLGRLDNESLLLVPDATGLRALDPPSDGVSEDNLNDAARGEKSIMIADGPSHTPTLTVQQLLGEASNRSHKSVKQQLQALQAPTPNLHDFQISIAVNTWLSTEFPSLLYLEYSGPSAANQALLRAAAQISKVCQSSGCPSAIYHRDHPVLSARKPDTAKASAITDLMLDLAYQTIMLLPPDGQQRSFRWTSLAQRDPSLRVCFDEAVTFLTAAFEVAPPNLHVIVDGFAAFWEAPSSAVQEFLRTLRVALGKKDHCLKLIIMTPFRLHSLLPLLEKDEVALINRSLQSTAPTAPILSARLRAVSSAAHDKGRGMV